jgi:hemerythrin-like metal-binding domain
MYDSIKNILLRKNSREEQLMFEMKPEYYTGIESIDVQHKRLFELVDETYNLLKDEFIPDKFDHIVTLLDELREYTSVHFKDEEEYMKKIDHKYMFSQVVEHKAFMDQLNAVDMNKLEEDQDSAILKLLNFLNDWLVNHILEKDLLIGK